MSTFQNRRALLFSLLISISTASLLSGQTPTPTPPDADGDGVPDHKDGWPHTSQIKSPPVPDSQYVVIDLGPGVANGINNLGDVVGKNISEKENTGLEAILWQLGQPPKFLGFLTEDTTVSRESVAWGINDSRQITGGATYRWDPNISGQYPDPPGSNSWGVNSDSHAFIWQNGAMTDLNDLSLSQTVDPNYPDPSNKVFSVGRAINNAGTVVGQSDSNAGTNKDDFHWFVVGSAPHAATFLGAPTDLGITQTPDGKSEAKAINDNGAIVGYGAGDGLAAFYRLNGVTQIIGPSDAVTNANGVNNMGHAVGNFGSPGQASLWVDDPALSAGARIVDLHAFGQSQNFTVTTAFAINDRDQIVGQGSINNSPSLEAILWQNGKLLRLNDLIGPHPGFTLRSATAISQNGMIVANDPNIGFSEAFLLIPFQLKQANYPTTKDTTDLGPTKERVIGGNDIAYITGFPQMPQLEAAVLSGAFAGLSVEWRMTVTSERSERGTKDNLNIPQTGVVELPINQTWKINDSFDAAKFFGGNCTIFYRLKTPDGYIDTERSLQFTIRGKNPKDSVARAYIESTQGIYRFAWAMAQHESRSPKNRVYNQFNSGGDLKELPNYSADKKNGWGLFQRDDTAGGIYVDTQQVYNWQSNTQVFYQEMIEKQAAQQRFFNAVAAAYPNIPAAQSPPSSFTFPGTITAMTALEAGTITLYNGAKKCPKSTLGGITYTNPWQFDRTSRQWSYTANSENYLYKVIYDEVEQHSPVVE